MPKTMEYEMPVSDGKAGEVLQYDEAKVLTFGPDQPPKRMLAEIEAATSSEQRLKIATIYLDEAARPYDDGPLFRHETD